MTEPVFTASVSVQPARSAVRPVRISARTGMILIALGLELVCVVADWYAVAHHLPYAAGGHGRAADVGRDWIANGTALGPPLAPMVLLAVALPGLAIRRWWGTTADVAAVVVAAAMLFGTVAEPSTRSVFTPAHFDAAQAMIRIAVLGSTSLLGAFTGRDLVVKFRRRGDRRAATTD
jgi:hypothetical protein